MFMVYIEYIGHIVHIIHNYKHDNMNNYVKNFNINTKKLINLLIIIIYMAVIFVAYIKLKHLLEDF